MKPAGLLLAVLAATLQAPSSARCAVGDGGAAGYFLNLGLGARALGMGYAQTAVSSDAGAVLWNPGNLARLYRGEAMAGNVLLPEGASYLFLGVGWPTIRYGSFGLAFTRLTTGKLDGRDEENAARADRSVEGAHTGVVVGYGVDVGIAMVGASAIVLHQSLWTAAQTGITANVGGSLDFGNVSPRLQGLSAALRLGDAIPAKFGTAATPLSVRIGLEYKLLSDALILGADADATQARAFRYAAGAEYTIRRLVLVRAGYNGQPTFGMGVRLGPVRADYAVAFLPLGLSHRASLSLPFGADLSMPRITVREPALQEGGRASVPTLKPNFDLLVESRESLDSVRIGGKKMPLKERNRFRLKQAVGLKEGKNTFVVEAENRSGKKVSLPIEILADTQPPTIEILEPKARTSTTREEVQFKAVLTDDSEIRAVTIGDLPAIIAPGTKVEISQPVPIRWSGKNTIRIAATDALGHTRAREIEVNREGGPPAPSSAEQMKQVLNEETAKQSLEKAKEFMRSGRFDVAAMELRYALRLVPTLGEAQQLLEKAEKEAGKMPHVPATGGVVVSSGESSAVAGMSDEIRKALEARLARGKQYYDLGQYKRAKIEFELVIELNKGLTGAVKLLEQTKLKINEYVTNKLNEARAAKQKGRLAPELTALRDALSQDEAHPVAREMFTQAKAKIPTEKRKLHLAALDLYAQNKIDQAIKQWEEALELDPDDEQIKTAVQRAQRRLIELRSGSLGK